VADPKVEAMRHVSIFEGLGNRELEAIARLFDEVDIPAERVLIREGDTGHEMFVVSSGRFAIERGGEQIAENGPGSVIGELALLSEGPRTATVRAMESSRILVAGHREFHALMEDYPTIREHLLECLAQRLREVDAEKVH